MTEPEIKIFHDSFDRCMKQDQRFFDLFYDSFLGSSAEVRQQFARTDLARQKRVLKVSLLMIIEAAARKTHDYSFLERTALRHSRSGAGIEPHLYELWLDALLRTVAVCDPQFQPEVEQVWRNAFQPAVDYIVTKY